MKRSLQQNKLLWAVCTDISQQLEWYGNKMSPEDWKITLSDEWKPQKIVPRINGNGFVVLNASTSKADKTEFSDLIEIIFAFCAEKQVRLSGDTMKQYESYREAQA